MASKEAKGDSALKLNGESTRQTKPRKRAADFLSDEENDEPAAPAQTEPLKKIGSKKAKKEESVSKPAAKKAASKAKQTEVVVDESEEDADAVFSAPDDNEGGIGIEDEEEDDQTAALIKGFESSGDEDESADEGFKPDQPVPRIPDSKKAKRKILKKQKKSDEPEEPGTVYVG